MQPKNKSAIYTRSQSHKNNLQSQWQRKFPKTQIPTTTSINQKRIVHHGEGKNMEMLSKSARQIEEAQKSRNCLNKQGVNFPSQNKQWRVAQAQNSTGREGFITDSRTIENQKKSCQQFKLPKSALVNVSKDRLLHHVQLICDQILFSSNNWQVLQGNSLLQSQNVLTRNS